MKERRMSKEIDAMSDCILPEDIILCILTRLPVKSLIRFKSVCKRWLELFASPKFIKKHYNQFSSYPINQVFIMSYFVNVGNQLMTLVTLENGTPDLEFVLSMPPCLLCSVGCLNGLICLCVYIDHKVGILLWNPAMRLSKFVPIPKADIDFINKISLGFGYDAQGDDFRVVKIVTRCPDYRMRTNSNRVDAEVYSAKSGTWIPIELPFQLAYWGTKIDGNSAIVNGNPYWVCRIVKNESLKNGDGVLLWCDVTRLEFKIVPLSGLKLEDATNVPFVDWKGSLAALLYTKSEERLESLDIWVFDDGEMVWRKNHTFGPIEMKVKRIFQCSKSGKIMGSLPDGKLFVLDPETRWVKEIEKGAHCKPYMKVTGYSESLVRIDGMKLSVVKLDEEEEQAQDLDSRNKLPAGLTRVPGPAGPTRGGPSRACWANQRSLVLARPELIGLSLSDPNMRSETY